MPSLETRERAEQRTGLVEDAAIGLKGVIDDLRELKEAGTGSRGLTHALTRAEESLAWITAHSRGGEYAR
jgi:hypothetical protein